jgi:hypothetical protein
VVHFPAPDRGERVKSLVEHGQFAIALKLLGETGPLDFIWPAHFEIQDIDDQGRRIGQYVPNRKIADKRDLTARCHFGLGHSDQAFPIVWKLLDQDPQACSDELLRMMAQSAAGRRDFGQIQQQLEALAEKDSPVAARALALVKIARDVHMGNSDKVLPLLGGKTVRRDDSQPFLKVGDGAWICRLIVAQPADWTPQLMEVIDARVRAAVNPSGEPLLVVHYLGLVGDQRAVASLAAYREVEANYGVRQTIDNALALIRTDRLMASYDDPRTTRIVRRLRAELGTCFVDLWHKQPPKLDADPSDQQRRPHWPFRRQWGGAEQALQIIHALARAGFFKDARESPDRPRENGWYLAVASASGKSYWQHYGKLRSPAHVPHIQALRRALDGKVAETLDDFLEGLEAQADEQDTDGIPRWER